jgi:hypothetical protein
LDEVMDDVVQRLLGKGGDVNEAMEVRRQQ